MTEFEFDVFKNEEADGLGSTFPYEQSIINQMLERFPVLVSQIRIKRNRRIECNYLERDIFDELFDYVVNEVGFHTFHMIVGMDEGADLGFIYILSNENKTLLMLKERVPKSSPIIRSICESFPNAVWHEREVVDLFGAVVDGLPEGPSYPLPDNWPKGNYPLRKDWNPAYFNKQTMTYEPHTKK